jgi:Anti-sigma-28 factor, FlgM
MIISDTEISKVLELNRPGPHACTMISSRNRAHPMAPDPGLRLTRLRGLREKLRAGTYHLEPDTIADKMIGRAIVDQIAQLVDRVDDAGD